MGHYDEERDASDALEREKNIQRCLMLLPNIERAIPRLRSDIRTIGSFDLRIYKRLEASIEDFEFVIDYLRLRLNQKKDLIYTK